MSDDVLNTIIDKAYIIKTIPAVVAANDASPDVESATGEVVANITVVKLNDDKEPALTADEKKEMAMSQAAFELFTRLDGTADHVYEAPVNRKAKPKMAERTADCGIYEDPTGNVVVYVLAADMKEPDGLDFNKLAKLVADNEGPTLPLSSLKQEKGLKAPEPKFAVLELELA